MQYRLLLLYFLLSNSLAAQQSVGLFQNKAEAFNGYTLFSNNESTYLIDNCGFVVHTWESNYKPGQSVYLLENGQLLRTGRIGSSFNTGGLGGRFELFDWDGTLLWSYNLATPNMQAHHDIAPLPNGNFLALVWVKRSTAAAIEIGREEAREFWTERIVEIQPVGTNEANIVWQWDVWNHTVQDIFSDKENFGGVFENTQLVNANYRTFAGVQQDWIHLNSIDYNPLLDQIIVSSRNFNEVWIIDHSTTTEEAAGHTGGRYGKGGDLLYRYGNPQVYNGGTEQEQVFFGQHDAQWIREGLPSAGELLIFNNNVLPNSSRVEIWSPSMQEVGIYAMENGIYPYVEPSWSYENIFFHSSFIAGAQMLPNGNVLICEGENGQFFEVTPEKERVWRYINPINRNGGPTAQGGTVRFNETFRVTRYATDYPAFEGKDLTPTIPVEINPWDSDCMIFDDVLRIEDTQTLSFKCVHNPVFEHLIVETQEKGVLNLFDIVGKRVLQQQLQIGRSELLISNIPTGTYIAIFRNSKQQQKVSRILKI